MGLRPQRGLGRAVVPAIDWETAHGAAGHQNRGVPGKREKEGGAGGGDEEQVQPPHPASPRPGGGDAPGAERAPGGVPEDVPRQLQRPIPGLCVRQPAGGAAAPQAMSPTTSGSCWRSTACGTFRFHDLRHTFASLLHQPGRAADQRVQTSWATRTSPPPPTSTPTWTRPASRPAPL